MLLSDQQQDALTLLERTDQWMIPAAYNRRAAPFAALARKGLAESRPSLHLPGYSAYRKKRI